MSSPSIPPPPDDQPLRSLPIDDLIERIERYYTEASDSSSLSGPQRTLDLSGHRLGRYELRHQIGTGSFGRVYLAIDRQLEREVALKLPRHEVLVDSKNFDRFLNEAKVAAKLHHPGIVTVYDAGWIESTPFIATLYCRGYSMAQWIQIHGDALCYKDTVRIMRDLAEAVQFIHDNGLIHCDLKPANILMVPRRIENHPIDPQFAFGSDHPMVTDFGLARSTQAETSEYRGQRIGSILYMAPEQAQGDDTQINELSDIFGLGAIFYHLLTGGPPNRPEQITHADQAALGTNILHPSLVCPNIPAELASICMRCLEWDPTKRFHTANALQQELDRLLVNEPIAAPRRIRWQRWRQWWAKVQMR